MPHVQHDSERRPADPLVGSVDDLCWGQYVQEVSTITVLLSAQLFKGHSNHVMVHHTKHLLCGMPFLWR